MLRKIEKKDLYDRCTKIIAKRIGDMITFDGYTGREISVITGIPENRLSEIKNGNTARLTEEYLAAFIGKGIITLDELKQHIGKLTAAQEQHLDEMGFYGDPSLKRAFIEAKTLGIDPVKTLLTEIKNKRNG